MEQTVRNAVGVGGGSILDLVTTPARLGHTADSVHCCGLARKGVLLHLRICCINELRCNATMRLIPTPTAMR